MDQIADIFLIAGALGAGVYCFVLAKRLARFNDLEKGVGGAVSALSAQVDELNRTMLTAKKASAGSETAMEDLTNRAEAVSRQLELLLASMHDMNVPEVTPSVADAIQDDASTPPQNAVFHSARASRQAANR